MGSETLTVGAIVFGRVITLDKTSVFFGMAPYIIPQQFHNHLIGFREEIKTTNGEIDLGLLKLYDEEFRDTYFEIREQLLNPMMPELQNTDGEPLVSADITYSLNCSLSDAFEALKTLSLIPPHELLQDAKYNSKGELLSLEFAWMEKGNKQNADWDNTVKGHLILEDQELKINVNSENRAEQIKRKISRRLGKRAIFESTFFQPVDELMEGLQGHPDLENIIDDEDLLQSPEIQNMLTEITAEHWKTWLDAPIPALNNQTPRKAAHSKKGRELLEGLLLDFQTMGKEHPETAPDLAMLRRELGMG